MSNGIHIAVCANILTKCSLFYYISCSFSNRSPYQLAFCHLLQTAKYKQKWFTRSNKIMLAEKWTDLKAFLNELTSSRFLFRSRLIQLLSELFLLEKCQSLKQKAYYVKYEIKMKLCLCLCVREK